MPDSESLLGQVISHYRIVEKIGGGDMVLSIEQRTPNLPALLLSSSFLKASRTTHMERWRSRYPVMVRLEDSD